MLSVGSAFLRSPDATVRQADHVTNLDRLFRRSEVGIFALQDGISVLEAVVRLTELTIMPVITLVTPGPNSHQTSNYEAMLFESRSNDDDDNNNNKDCANILHFKRNHGQKQAWR